MARFRYERGEQPLEGYTVEHGLGVGGFGEVYFATSDSGREVALKAVQNYQEIELRGIRNCMNLKSPHLVTIFDVKHNHRGDPFVIMEYVDGPSLRSLLDAAPDGLGATKAAFFLREIAKGLTYLHDAGVVHRDLKPHNVFYEEGYVKIGDYSLCKLITTSQHTGHTMTVGSVHYMAPEISQGRYDSGVDIYALGVMLYEMLTGTPPFTGDSIGEILMKQLNEEPDLSRLEEPFRSVVARAMAKDPEARYANAAEIVEGVYGSQNIQDSVVAFNPQELTMVAHRVAGQAEKINVGGGHDETFAKPVGFESGDASAWKRGGSDSSGTVSDAIPGPPPVPVSGDTDAPAKTVAQTSKSALASLCQPDAGPKLRNDRMPIILRYGMGLASVCAVCALAGQNEEYFGNAAFLTFTTVAFLTLLRDICLKRIAIESRLAPRFLQTIVVLLAVPLFYVILLGGQPDTGNAFGSFVPARYVYAGLLPLVVFNLHRLTHARREQRFEWHPVVLAGIFAVALSALFGISQFLFVPVAVATSSLISLQIVSPYRRIA